MKNPLKRIVPILLAIAVVGCAVWYLFVYDRDFARDMLISQARHFDSNGDHDIAAWFYDQAYIYADNDASVAIELAQQYKDSGNYTKAEYTLTNAIASGGSAELYIALSQTFVEQDKLMDAVNLLDKIADPAIKQELDALRPAVPAVSNAPGFYTEYISVELSAGDGTLLFSTDGEYPSVAEDAYIGSISLGQGQTTVYTLCIADNGLVSPLGIYGYTIGGVIEPVTFADAAIEAQVRQLLGASEDTILYTDDLWTITEFTVPQEAAEYDDLAKLTYLKSLTIYNAVSGELSNLAGLAQLQELLITGCEVDQQTLTSIASLSELTKLTLAHCSLSDISALAAVRGLEYLDLSYNSIRNISPLSAMGSLRTLYLGNNALTDLSELGGLASLTTLNVSYNSITSLAPICANLTLTDLNASNNLLTGLDAIDNLPDLTDLDVSHNALTDISALSGCDALVKLNISNNDLTDISALAPLMELRELNCSYNTISELPQWSAAIALVTLDASYNQISDLTPLSQLMSLNTINMDYNAEISSVDPLATCPNLIKVNLFGTKVIDVDILTEQSIIVNYNPTDVNVDVPEPTETQPEEPQ